MESFLQSLPDGQLVDVVSELVGVVFKLCLLMSSCVSHVKSTRTSPCLISVNKCIPSECEMKRDGICTLDMFSSPLIEKGKEGLVLSED